MKYFAEILPKDRFFRIHKSFIVNLDKIEKFHGTTIEIQGKSLPLSRNKKETFLKYIEF